MGNYGRDEIKMGDQKLTNTDFELAEEVTAQWFYTYAGFDGVLGISPSSSAWKAFTADLSREESVMGLRLPREYSRRWPGETPDLGALTLGGIDPDFEDATFLDLPLARGGRSWGTPLYTLDYYNATHRRNVMTPGGARVRLVTSDPFLTLPKRIFHELGAVIEREATGYGHFGLPLFPCSVRDILPYFLLSMGDESTGPPPGPTPRLNITAYDYAIEMSEDLGTGTCMLGAVPREEGDDSHWADVDLGWLILRKFYTVLEAKETKDQWGKPGKVEGRIRCESCTISSLLNRIADRYSGPNLSISRYLERHYVVT